MLLIEIKMNVFFVYFCVLASIKDIKKAGNAFLNDKVLVGYTNAVTGNIYNIYNNNLIKLTNGQ